MTEGRIARLDDADVDAVAALAHIVWQATYPALIPPAQIDEMLADRYAAPRIRQQLTDDGHAWWVAKDNGAVVGFAHTYLDADAAKLDKLYVHPDCQHRGIGAALLDATETWARERGAHRVWLQVNRGNTQALAAYDKYGFRTVEARVFDIGGGFVMDDYVMEKPLRFDNPDDVALRALLAPVRTIAVVGLSPKPARPSHRVAEAMQYYGMRIVPVRPGVDAVLGEKAYPTLADIPFAVDLVDVFRASEHVPAIVDACLALHLPAIWLQEGIVHDAAALKAQAAGMTVVMDRCLLKDYVRLFTT